MSSEGARAAGGTYGGLRGVVVAFERALLYHPSGSALAPEAYGLSNVESVYFPAEDGTRLFGWFAPPQPERPTILYFHGNGHGIQRRAPRLKAFQGQGWGALLVSYRGYPGSAGRPNEAGLYADGAGALAFLAARGIEAGRIVVLGESLGSGVATELAARIRFRALILEAPFTSVPEVAQRHFWFLPARALMRDRFPSLARMPRIAVPILIVHGERDAVTPVVHGRRLLAAATAPAQGVFLPRAGHNNLWDHGGFEAIKHFIDRLD